jgi:hypothetical protein
VTEHSEFGETLDLGDLPRYWQLVTERYERVQHLPRRPPAQELTARVFDEAQPAGHRVYFAADRYLSVAMDNHLALLALLEHHGASHSAPWSLLRPAFECGFFACWVLDPDDGLQRRRRGLWCEVADEAERQRHMESLSTAPETAKTVQAALARRRNGPEKTYRSEAQSLGLEWGLIRRRPNVVDELPKLRFLAQESALIRATMVANWRMLSGYEHGLGWALMHGSDAKIHAKIPGGQEMELTIKDDAFVNSAKATMWLLLEAIARLEKLSTSIV